MRLNLRITPAEKRVLNWAARASNCSIGEFVLEPALATAEDILPARTTFGLDASQWKAFLKALDEPPRPAARLAKLLREKSVFERGEFS
jgi:uncharacterized protein (DUF1778 family)